MERKKSRAGEKRFPGKKKRRGRKKKIPGLRWGETEKHKKKKKRCRRKTSETLNRSKDRMDKGGGKEKDKIYAFGKGGKEGGGGGWGKKKRQGSRYYHQEISPGLNLLVRNEMCL